DSGSKEDDGEGVGDEGVGDENSDLDEESDDEASEINVINGIAPKIISNRGYAYKRAYKNAIKTAQAISYQKIGDTYEIFYGDWLNFEDFK
ncbi:2449_t:CDS:2, partial [Entrophospora sp. SA101]